MGVAGEETGETLPEDALRAAVRILVEGGLLVHPTSTVYGIGAGIPEADREIARLKGRSPDRPLLRIAADEASLRRAHPDLAWNEAAHQAASAFWPGPLTLVLDDGSPDGLAVRVESHPTTAAALRSWGRTMSSTSLNPSGSAPTHRLALAEEVLEGMPGSDRSVLWLDAGDLPGGPPSTLLDVRGRPVVLLREGAISIRALKAVLGPIMEGGVSGG